MQFDWDDEKNAENIRKHGVSFELAKLAFTDTKKVVITDDQHSTSKEKRYFCLGIVGQEVVTVRFTVREGKIRTFGAGYWREGKKRYDKA